jgi:hypothetical protein
MHSQKLLVREDLGHAGVLQAWTAGLLHIPVDPSPSVCTLLLPDVLRVLEDQLDHLTLRRRIEACSVKLQLLRHPVECHHDALLIHTVLVYEGVHLGCKVAVPVQPLTRLAQCMSNSDVRTHTTHTCMYNTHMHVSAFDHQSLMSIGCEVCTGSSKLQKACVEIACDGIDVGGIPKWVVKSDTETSATLISMRNPMLLFTRTMQGLNSRSLVWGGDWQIYTYKLKTVTLC